MLVLCEKENLKKNKMPSLFLDVPSHACNCLHAGWRPRLACLVLERSEQQSVRTGTNTRLVMKMITEGYIFGEDSKSSQSLMQG